MGAILYRLSLFVINIFCPPLTILIIAGPGYDCILNCCLFLLAVIPSHIHGFYLSCTYFHRRGLAARGRWPGGPKHFIDSHHILNGGVSDADAARLYYKEFGVPLHGHGSSDEKLVARHRSTAKGSKRSNGSRRESGSQRGRRYSGAQRPVSNGGVAGYIAPPSRSGSQRASVVEHSGHVYPQSQQQQLVQRGGSQRVPQRTGSVNSGMAYGHQPGYGSAPVSPIVGAPLGRNGSHRSAGVRGW